MSTYNLVPGKLPYCRGKYDKDSGTYIENTLEEATECCINNCTDRIEYCYKTCHENFGPDGNNSDYYSHQSCHQRCNELLSNCENGCYTVDSDLNNIKNRYKLNKFTHKKSYKIVYIIIGLILFLFIIQILILIMKMKNM